jgi:hypothetical protein
MKQYKDKSRGNFADGFNMVTHQAYGDVQSGYERIEGPVSQRIKN